MGFEARLLKKLGFLIWKHIYCVRDTVGMDDLYVFDGNCKPDVINRITLDYHRVKKIKPKEVPEDFVLVPAGKDNHEAVVEVVNIEYFSEENVPLPIEKTKRIIRVYYDIFGYFTEITPIFYLQGMLF